MIDQRGKPQASTQNISDPTLINAILCGVDAAGNMAPVAVESGGLKIAQPIQGGQRRRAAVKLTAVDATVFTADRDYRNVQLLVANVDGVVDRTFQIHHVGLGETATDANCISGLAMNLVRGDPPMTFTGLAMRKGEKINGLCSSANKVTVIVHAEDI